MCLIRIYEQDLRAGFTSRIYKIIKISQDEEQDLRAGFTSRIYRISKISQDEEQDFAGCGIIKGEIDFRFF